MTSDLNRLYRDYEQAIIKQKKLIEEYAGRLSAARKKRDSGEVARLNRMMRLLYEEKWEMEGHAVNIREYLS